MATMKVALSDGLGGSMVATDISDILFGEPKPVRSQVKLGVLKEDEVNVVVNGHVPLLSEVIAEVAARKDLGEKARGKGAKGINVVGLCCSANEISIRRGIPVAGNFLQQGLALVTGAVELMLVDIQCLMPSLSRVAACYHTKVVSTHEKARFPGMEHFDFNEENALKKAEEWITAVSLSSAAKSSKKEALGEDFSDLPVAAAAPEWMSEKAIAIGWYAVESGLLVVFGSPLPVGGSKNVERLLTRELFDLVGGGWAFEKDPIKAARIMIEHINRKRELLKLKPVRNKPLSRMEEEIQRATA